MILKNCLSEANLRHSLGLPVPSATEENILVVADPCDIQNLNLPLLLVLAIASFSLLGAGARKFKHSQHSQEFSELF